MGLPLFTPAFWLLPWIAAIRFSFFFRPAWAERAKTVGYPERFAQEALGHNSKAVHRA